MKLTHFPARRLLVALVSLFLITFVIWQSGIANVWQRLVGFPIWALAGILALLLANLFLVSFRFWRVLAHFGIVLPWKAASHACMAGHAAGLVVISLFGQVMGRQAVMRHYGVQPVVNASLAIYERTLLASISGVLGVLGGVYLLGNAVIANFFQHLSLAEVTAAALGGVGLSLWLGRSRFEASLFCQIFSRTNITRGVLIAGLTLGAQLLVLGSFVLGILAVNPEIPVVPVFAAAAVISFAASMPVSLNGWGVRELAAVYVLGKLGISAGGAVAVSVIVGLCATLVILGAFTFSFKMRPVPVPVSAKPQSATPHSAFEIEKVAAWILGMAVAAAVFFQVHLTLPGGVINVNLADPFAILALAAVALHALFSRQTPRWKIQRFNLALGAVSLLLLFGFLRGWLEIGVTQWALEKRLMGWLVLLGYLSAGYLIVASAGVRGIRRLAETLISTAAVVVTLQVALRLLEYWGMDLGTQLTPNFEGYAGNRNAFAFQLIVVVALLLAYSHVYEKHGVGLYRSARPWVFSVLLGVLLAGLGWTGSRAGMLVGLLALLLAGILHLADRRMLAWGLILAGTIWAVGWLVAGHGPVQSAISGHSPVQSAISGEFSNQERWETMAHALEMWRQTPIFGAGLGVFIAKSSAWLEHPQVVHSTPLWILSELGLVGMAVMGWIFFLLAHHATRPRRMSPARRVLLLMIMAFAVFSLAHEIFFQRIFWFVLGAALARPFVSRGRV